MKLKGAIKIGLVSALAATMLIGNTIVFAAETKEAEASVNEAENYDWNFSVYGTSTNEDDNGYEGEISDGSVRVYSLNGKGKIVPKSTDGIAFYYTTLPADRNFTLTATGHVNNWFYSNGQEGFGLMAADRVGEGNSAVWNNSYAAAITGYSYMADSGNKINMKVGVNAIERFGITPDNLYYFDQQDADTIASYYNTTQCPIESYCATMDAGTYNIMGNSVDAAHPYEEGKSSVSDYTALKLDTTVKEITDFKLTIQKNNTGYFVSYEDESGKVNTKKFYVLGDNPLTCLDSDNIYAGFFAARNMDVTFDNIELTTSNPSDDAPAETPENTYIDLDAGFKNVDYANQPEEDLRFYSNWDGKLAVENAAGETIYDDAVKSGEYVVLPVALEKGANSFTYHFTPDEEFHYGYDENHPINLYNVLKSYDEITDSFEIEYSSYEELGDTIYVSPEGTANGEGTKEAPFDLVTASKFVQPGQTIILAEGRYEYEESVKLARDINGLEGKEITLMADPEAATRPVIDFLKTGTGLTLGGNYWILKGFDVTGTANGSKGLSVAGSNCVIDDMHTYYNGNTGLQVYRYVGYDSKESGMWPHDVLVKNCTSYDNADSGFEDADGFAAKLCVGDNVVFENCISHHNADDGWDLFAKSETGTIGAVTIKDCVAYMNGYIHIDGREEEIAPKLRGNFTQTEGFVADEEGSIVDAGNGNGFKLGGEGLKGGHRVIGSRAFMNKANGVTSNSCPDVKVYNTISFDNGSSNIALYTGDKIAGTDFSVDRLVTFRKNIVSEKEENLQCKGTQNNSVVLNKNNYIFSIEKNICENSEGTEFKEEYFKSLVFEPETDELSRNEDGSINMGDFLVFADDVDSQLGFEISKAYDENISVVSSETVSESDGNEADSVDAADNKEEKLGFWAAIVNWFKNLFKL